MRIAHIIDSLAPGGAERVAVSLAGRLAHAGHRVDLLVSERGGALEEHVPSGVSLHHLQHHLLWGLDGVGKLRALLRSSDYDILHCHLLGSDIIGRTAGLLSPGVAVVSTQHDSLERGFRYDAFRRVTSRLIDATVACSPSVEEFCRDHLRVPAARLHRIDNGVDVAAFEGRSAGATSQRTFVTVANLTPVKGHRHLLEAIAATSDSGDDRRFLLAGEGGERAALEALAAELGISAQVDFLGSVTDVPALLAESDGFILPSLNEGLPMALLEAMAAEKFIIATDVGANRALLGDGAAGVLVPPGDSRALASVLAALPQPDGAAAMAGEARRTVERDYSIDAMTRRYLSLYERILQGRSR